MEIIKNKKTSKALISLVLFLLGVASHFLTTISFNDIDIRVSVTDIFIGPLFLFSFFQTIYAKKITEICDQKYLFISILAFSIWVLFSMIIGRLSFEQWMNWAVINKTLGWFILMSYLFVGLWLKYNYPRYTFILVNSFIITGGIIAFYGVISYWVYIHNIYEINQSSRLEGFFSNPNAFGISMCVVFFLSISKLSDPNNKIKYIFIIVCSSSLIALFFSGSRSAFLGFLFSIPLLILVRRIDLKKTITIIIPVIFYIFIFSVTPTALKMLPNDINSLETIEPKKEKKINEIYTIKQEKVNDAAIMHRIAITKRALNYWAESPLIGIGIGGFIWNDMQNGVQSFNTIHNSALWILVEMGAIGLILFICIVYFGVKKLWKNKENNEDLDMLFIIIIFIGASIGTEVLYQRYFWLFLGLSLINNKHYLK